MWQQTGGAPVLKPVGGPRLEEMEVVGGKRCAVAHGRKRHRGRMAAPVGIEEQAAGTCVVDDVVVLIQRGCALREGT